MSRELCHQQEALWELLTTELIYVRKLKIMTDVSCPQLQPRPLPQPFTHLPCIVPLLPGQKTKTMAGGGGEGRGAGSQEISAWKTCPGSWEAG